jgi:hypothetical protein
MARHEDVPATVDVDDPDLLVARVGDPPAVGRPLRLGDVLVRCRDDGRAASPEGQDDELTRAGDLLRAGDDAVAGMEAELARAVHRDETLDGQPAGRGRHRRAR